jgi:enterochelin esterase family protein
MKTNLLPCAALFCLLSSAGLVFGADAPAAGTTPAPSATPGAPAPRRGGPPGPPATPEDIASMAKLNDLPPYATGLADGDYSVGPAYKPAPEQTPRDGVPKGKVIQFTMDSTESKFYPTANGMPFKRAVAVYIPPGYVPGTPAPCIVAADQYGLRNNQLPTILDNMLADHRLPAMVAIMIAPGPGGERSIEYDTVSTKYDDFFETEVLPRVEKEANVKITMDPDGRMAEGGSSGGAVAFTMAWFHPELYHRVLTYSGTYVNLKNGPDAPHGAWEYNEHFIPDNPAKPLRVWMEVAQNDNGGTTAASGFHNWIIANQNMAAVLKAKGYHYQLVYAKAAGHTDSKAIAQTLPSALEWVWRGYKPVTK